MTAAFTLFRRAKRQRSFGLSGGAAFGKKPQIVTFVDLRRSAEAPLQRLSGSFALPDISARCRFLKEGHDAVTFLQPIVGYCSLFTPIPAFLDPPGGHHLFLPQSHREHRGRLAPCFSEWFSCSKSVKSAVPNSVQFSHTSVKASRSKSHQVQPFYETIFLSLRMATRLRFATARQARRSAGSPRE